MPNHPKTPAILSSRLIAAAPFFYGWVVLAVGALAAIMSSPGQAYTIAIFVEPLMRELGVSRTALSSFYTVGTLAGSLGLPLMGRLLDRHGPRGVVTAISLFLGAACIYMGSVQTGWMLLLGFIALRLFGQGGLPLAGDYVINQWWRRRRGLATGLAGAASALLGMGLFPNLVTWSIDWVGWRATYMILGGCLIGGMAPVAALLLRARPEVYGLAPDGDTHPAPASGDVQTVDEEHWTAAEALRTPAFWIIVAGVGTLWMLSSGLIFHTVGIFADNQLSPTTAAAVFVPVAVTNAAVTLASGVLADRIAPRVLLAAALLLQSSALLMAQVLTGVPVAVAYGVMLGGLMGLQRTISAVVWANYFGRRHLGSITGLATTLLVAASALGPLPLGIARDWLGEYNRALTFLALLPLALCVVSLRMRRPHRVNTVD